MVIATLWVSLVSFEAITLCVASQREFIFVVVVDFVMTQCGNFWIHPPSRSFATYLYSDLRVIWM
jgi:hypothetical protein